MKTKKFNIFSVIMLCISLHSFSQLECDHKVSTEYNNPENISLPNGDFRYLNRFNWNQRDNSTGFLSYYDLSNMQYNQQMQNLMSDQAASYYSYIYNGEKMTYNNGWELLLLNIGTFPNGENNPNQDLSDVPYIVLYNRYSGTVRVFANYGNGHLSTGISVDAMRIELLFDNIQMNGILRLSEGYDQALDQETDVQKSTSLAFHPNSPNKWFSGDFQIAYDPCLCYYPSRMRLRFIAIENQNLQLHGREISIEQDLINGAALNTKDFLSNFDYTGEDASGGIIMYKALDYLVSDYRAKLQAYQDQLIAVNEHNDLVSRNLAIIDAFDFLVLQGGSAAIVSVLNKPWFSKLLKYGNDLIGAEVLKKDDIVKEAQKGFANGFKTLIANNFQKLPTPTSPITPKATFSEMSFKGNISNETPIDGPNFFTPGTYGSPGTGEPNLTSYPSYPVYNDILGTFALLESPKVVISHTVQDNHSKRHDQFYQTIGVVEDGSFFGHPGQVWGVESRLAQDWTNNYQIKLANDLSYTFNPALDIKGTPTIEASFVIKAKPRKLPFHGFKNVFAYNDPNYTTNMQSTSLDVNQYQKVVYPDHNLGDFENGNNILLNETYLAQQSKNKKDSLRYNTPFLDVNAFHENISSFALKNEYIAWYKTLLDQQDPDYPSLEPKDFWWQPDVWNMPEFSEVSYNQPPLVNPANIGFQYDFDIELKLIINMEFNTLRDDGTPNTLSQILTFKVRPEDVILQNFDLYANLETSAKDYTQYPENLSFSDTIFQGQAITGCELVGNTYTCQSWNDITLEGNITAAPSYHVSFIAGNEINQINESVLNGEIVNSIQMLLDYSHPMPESSQAYVSNFCQANKPSTKILTYLEEKEKQKQLQANLSFPLDFTLFPNPATETATISLNQRASSAVNIEIHDLTGKVQEVQVNTGDKTNYRLNVANLAQGLYLVKVSAMGETKTKQLIIK